MEEQAEEQAIPSVEMDAGATKEETPDTKYSDDASLSTGVDGARW